MLRVAHADPSAVVNGHPGRPARRVQQRIQKGPVRYRVRAVAHTLGLAIRARHGSAVEMVAADDDRCLQFAVANHFIERETEAVALAETDPADARRKSLELNLLAG